MTRFITKLLSVSLSLCLIIGLFITPTTVYAQNLNDIENSWAKEEIQEWLERGLVTGYLDNTFRPQDNITRAEFVAIINRTFGFTKMDSEMFSDVDDDIWYYKEVSIAKAAEYISGYIGNKFKPESNIKRQEVAAILYRLLKLNSDGETTELEQFNDYDNIQLWSKVYLNEVAKEGYITGYPDLTFRPEKAITRQETVAILDRVVGKYINESGNYGPEEGKEVVEGNLTINKDDVVLKNTTIKGNLYLAAGIGEGDVELDNVTVEGRTIISGGGENSITFTNSTVGEMIVYKIGGKIRVLAVGTTEIGETKIESDTKLEEEGLEGEGFGEVIVLKEGQTLEIDGDFELVKIEADGATVAVDDESNVESLVVKSEASISSEGTINNVTIDAEDKNVELSGEFTEVSIKSSTSVEVVEGSSVEQIEVTEEANGADITLQEGSEVEALSINASIEVSGEGSVDRAEINAENVNIEQEIPNIILDDSIDFVVIGGETVNESTDGDTEPSGGSNSGGSNPGGSGGITTPKAPDSNLSGITNQVVGTNGSRKVTLTITVKDEDGKGLTGYTDADFTVIHMSPQEESFADSSGFVNFTDNEDGTYNVDVLGGHDATIKLVDLKVDSVIIEEGPTDVNIPEALVITTSPSGFSTIRSMVSEIIGETNPSEGTIIDDLYGSIKNPNGLYLNSDGSWSETAQWLPISNTGINYDTWILNITDDMKNSINPLYGTYYFSTKAICGEVEYIDFYNYFVYIIPTPSDELSGLTSQVKGPYGSGKVTLTISVNDEYGNELTNYNSEDFMIEMASAGAFTFNEANFSEFKNNFDGTYNVDYSSSNGTTSKLYNLIVDDVLIEEGPIEIFMPEALVIPTSIEYYEILNNMISNISGEKNPNIELSVDSLYGAFRNVVGDYIDINGNWSVEEQWIPIANTGTNFDTWNMSISESVRNSIDSEYGSYYFDVKAISNEEVYINKRVSILKIEPPDPEFNIIDDNVIYYLFNGTRYIEIFNGCTIEEVLNSIELVENADNMYISDENYQIIEDISTIVNSSMVMVVENIYGTEYYDIEMRYKIELVDGQTDIIEISHNPSIIMIEQGTMSNAVISSIATSKNSTNVYIKNNDGDVLSNVEIDDNMHVFMYDDDGKSIYGFKILDDESVLISSTNENIISRVNNIKGEIEVYSNISVKQLLDSLVGIRNVADFTVYKHYGDNIYGSVDDLNAIVNEDMLLKVVSENAVNWGYEIRIIK